MSRGKLKLLFASALVLLLAFTTIGPVLANELDSKRGELEGISDQRKEADEQRKILRGDIAVIEARIATIDKELSAQRAKVTGINNDIRETEETITLKEQEIIETEEYLEEQTGYFETRMRAMYQRGNVGYLEVLFSSTNFSDFLSRFNSLRTILEDDVRLVEEIKEKKEFLEVEKVEQEKRKERLVVLKDDAVRYQRQIEDDMQEQQKLNEQLHMEVQHTQAYIDELEKASKEVERQIKEIQDRLAREAMDLSRGEATGTLAWPVPGFNAGWITSPYGWRTHPIRGGTVFHSGIDVGIPRTRWEASPNFNGSAVDLVAADGGLVIFAGGNAAAGYGRYVIIDHGGGIATLYAHMHRFTVEAGQAVAKGQVIGTIGSTGNSTGPHVHYEVRVNGQHTNPMTHYR